MFTADPLLPVFLRPSGPWLLEDWRQDTSERAGILWEARSVPKAFWLRHYPT